MPYAKTFRLLLWEAFSKTKFLLVFSFLYLNFTFADRNVCTQSPRKICRLKDCIGGYTRTSCTYSLRPGFHPEPVRVGFVVCKVAVVQVFSGVPPFSPVNNIPQMLHTHSVHQRYIILEIREIFKQGAKSVPKLKGGGGSNL